MHNQSKKYTPREAREKIEVFCNYQERHQNEVRTKLYSFGLISDDVESILSDLISKGLVNEERFSKLYAGGKFRQKKWGRNKIVYELKFKGISERNIKTGLKEIDPFDYENCLKNLIQKHKEKVTKPGIKEWQKKQLVIKQLIAKGYETDLILLLYDEAE